ncbi:MAG: hypothetical protein ACK4K7_12195 [Allosphingosinicella sp.]|uniref:hypothetical protein n=1 Tax=Allosphingosinicella sp. TaxID=2823234 RepID=UPI00393A9214
MVHAFADRPQRVRSFAWIAAAALILVPLFAMKIADPAAWELADLPFAFIMIAAVGLAFELALRVPARFAYRFGAAIALGTAFLLIWGNLAVGFAGSEENRINIIFFAVPALALAGGLLGGFRPGGLAAAMAGAATAQLLAGLIALAYGYFTGPLTVAFTGLWLASSLTFLRARTATAARNEG